MMEGCISKSLETFNLAMLGKKDWIIMMNPYTLIARLDKAKILSKV